MRRGALATAHRKEQAWISIPAIQIAVMKIAFR
jgi:hypothetical protein